ncbi:MAG TPA: hypothetical protein VMQ10_12230 [Spirochaetia bacterium]|nr:hypothetical protein [Spirochaetia bacterium]
MDADHIPAASSAGVDFISVGALTHSVRSFDFSLKLEPAGQGGAGRGAGDRPA